MDAEVFFAAVKEIWAPLASLGRVIPLCTPVPDRVTTVVIGTNHSEFSADDREAERIAEAFASNVPFEHTYLDHTHKFAHGLRQVCERAGVEVNHTWVGTNRCGVQTGPEGVRGLKKHVQFRSCQERMDNVLSRFVFELSPRNVILVGKHAARWWYDDIRLVDMQPGRIKTAGGAATVVAIPHVSRGVYWADAAERISCNYEITLDEPEM